MFLAYFINNLELIILINTYGQKKTSIHNIQFSDFFIQSATIVAVTSLLNSTNA